jgi:hypothetical protein
VTIPSATAIHVSATATPADRKSLVVLTEDERGADRDAIRT